MLDSLSGPVLAADFQSLYAAILLLERLPNGRYPEREQRHTHALSMAEYLRQVIMRGAQERGITVVTTNSDGRPERRQNLLRGLGPGSREIIIDPGIELVSQRLSVDGVLSENCNEAIRRWYSRT